MVTAINLRQIQLYAHETQADEKITNYILHECEDQAYAGKLSCLIKNIDSNIFGRNTIEQVIRNLNFLGFNVSFTRENNIEVSWEYKAEE